MTEQDPLDLLLERLDGVISRHGYWMARCPVHDDSTASLSIGRGTEQPVVLRCQAGCDTVDVLTAIGLTAADLCAPDTDRPGQGEWTPCGEATEVYDYTDEDGKLLFQVCRAPGKQFPCRVPDPLAKSGWRWSMKNTRRVLYRLDRLRPAIDAGEIIYVVEGEKDVHAVERCGHVATCNPGGTGGGWRPEFSEALSDAIVIIVADADQPGREHAHKVAAALDGIAAAVEIREAAEGKDTSDHLASGRTLADLIVTSGEEVTAPELAMTLTAFMAQDDPPVRWVIPSLIERGDRVLWTGWEGLGKTTAIRQVAVCAAAGIQPFWPLEHFPPQVVVYIDCENRVARSRRHFRRVAAAVERFRPLAEENFRIVHRPGGVNLMDGEDAAFVLERVTAYRPDLLVIGPLYKLHEMDVNEETAARAVVRVLELAVGICESALIVEAHSSLSGTPRELRPRGSSLFMAWPDYGIGIRRKDRAEKRRVMVDDWRGPRDETDWPRELVWGSTGELPWTLPMDIPRRPTRADYTAGDD
jgi:5S rRNA maturation endonuclease (ribonuclease M5)